MFNCKILLQGSDKLYETLISKKHQEKDCFKQLNLKSQYFYEDIVYYNS